MITSTWIWHMVGWRWWNIGSSCQTSDTRRRQGWMESVELKWSKSITFWSKRITVFWKSNTFLIHPCLPAPRHQECTTCIWLTKWIIHCSNPRDFIAPHTTFQCITEGSPCTMVSFGGALPGSFSRFAASSLGNKARILQWFGTYSSRVNMSTNPFHSRYQQFG